MHPYTFIISIRAHHPKNELAFLSPLLEIKPSRSWVAGEPRTTPKGTSLGGTRSKSLWTARLTDKETRSDEWELEDLLEQAVEKLSPHAATLNSFMASGGTLELYISLFGSRNFGVILNPELLSRLSALKVELQLDIYPEASKS